MDGRALHEDVMSVRTDPAGLLRVTWTPGVEITEELASSAVRHVEEVNGGRRTPLLVDITGVAAVPLPARLTFGSSRSVSRLALLGHTRVDEMIASFVGGLVPDRPWRFFTDERKATEWLLLEDGTSGDGVTTRP